MERKELTEFNLTQISENRFSDYFITIQEMSTTSGTTYTMWVHFSNGTGCFNYAKLFEAYADLYRIVVGDLEFIADSEGYITDKIYRYKEE